MSENVNDFREPDARYEISKSAASRFVAIDNEPTWGGKKPLLIGEFSTKDAAVQAINDHDQRTST